VAQPDHAQMCAELADAWGNERFGRVEPAEEVRLAASDHELGWVEWERNPTLNTSTGLPYSVLELDLAEYVDFQLAGPRRLAERSPYAALLTVNHHMSFYSRPSAIGLLSPRGRLVKRHLDRSGAYRDELRARVDAGDDEIERNWRLVRGWDAISHDLLHERAPATRQVPAASGPAEIHLKRSDGSHTMEPWPFAQPEVTVRCPGRLLTETFSDQEEMRTALAQAPRITLEYELRPGGDR
jgi:hypothetical protein